MVLRNSSCREQGNLLATAKWALPRHTASHDLLKKHNGASSPHSSLFVSHLSPLLPSASFLFPYFDLLSLYCIFHFFGPHLQWCSQPSSRSPPPAHSAGIASFPACVHWFERQSPLLTSLIQIYKVSPFVLIYLQRNSICISRKQNEWRPNLP